MQGASAVEKVLQDYRGCPLRVYVIWEPVLPTDWTAPTTAALRRVADGRAVQYWDKDRLISKELGEHDRGSIVWDRVIVYAPGARWNDAPPLFSEGPVVKVLEPLRAALTNALASPPKQPLAR